jgi:hypothetical protein
LLFVGVVVVVVVGVAIVVALDVVSVDDAVDSSTATIGADVSFCGAKSALVLAAVVDVRGEVRVGEFERFFSSLTTPIIII